MSLGRLGWIALLLTSTAFLLGGCAESDQPSEAEQFEAALEEAGFTEQDADVRSNIEVKSWLAKFCSLEPGMTRTEVREVMGEPTESFNDSTANQDSWSGYNVNVTAFYDIDDRVEQLDDSTGTSNLPCPSGRR